ncbi:MAG: hypothetical protein K2H85_06215 [Allobaculum sp.]|nr:hypothetical protein [Allobaculum sp.]
MLRCLELGLTPELLDQMTVGFVLDMLAEKANDSYDYPEMANQDDFDRF